MKHSLPFKNGQDLRMDWPQADSMLSDTAPFLLAGVPDPLIRNISSSKARNEQPSTNLQLPSLESVVRLRKKKDEATKDPLYHPQKASVIHIYSKKLCDDLNSTPILPCKTVTKVKVDASIKSIPLHMDLSHKLKIPEYKDAIHIIDFHHASHPSPSIKDVQHPDLLVSHYNRKAETNIYTKPPTERRVKPVLTLDDPEFGVDQNWIDSWKPVEKFVKSHLKDIFIGDPPAIQKEEESYMHESCVKIPPKQAPRVADTMDPYLIPQRQEYKKLDERFVARLVEKQTGHVAHRHRRMKPTLGVPSLNRGKDNKQKALQIGPLRSVKYKKHVDVNEEPDDLDLSLQLRDLSIQERNFESQLHSLQRKEILSRKRAQDKRREASSHIFRNHQEQVEKAIHSQNKQAIIRRVQMNNFLNACGKHRIFLEVYFAFLSSLIHIL